MALPQPARALQPGDILLVVHDFDARSGDELTLRRSERVELIELDDGFGDGWYLGKHLTRGGTGLFPGVYTTKANSATRSPGHSPNTSTAHQPATINHSSATSTSFRHSAATPQATSSTDPADGVRASLPAAHHSHYVQRSISEALVENEKGSDSPVMSETLNEIDQHITNLGSPPRVSLGHIRIRSDSESEYSSHIDRQSFLAGPETDEEDNGGLDETTVRSWDEHQVAQHLQDLGVEPKHCDIFREQEISGEVLLDMDQNFIYMKEFDFGVMGRRLKTWHRIRDFQREVKQQALGSRRGSNRAQDSSVEELGRMSNQPSLSRLNPSLRQNQEPLSIAEEASDVPQPLQMSQTSKRASWAGGPPSATWKTQAVPESPVKTSATVHRRSRRHSSIDFGAQPDLELSSLSTASPQKKLSTDRSWSAAGTASTQATTPTSSIRPSTKEADHLVLPISSLQEESPPDIDRGYFSSNEVDNKKTRSRLSKGPRGFHSRQTSLDQRSKRTSMIKKHARISSAGSVREDLAPSIAAASYHSSPKLGRFRSASTQATSAQSPSMGASPAVTNLENDSTSNISSPAVEKMKMQDRAKKLIGLRTTSDTSASGEKVNANKIISLVSTNKSSDLVASPQTGDTTPSAPSLDMDTPEGEHVSSTLSKYTSRPRPKNKLRTSAYTHGLLKIPPSEARKHCDHSGWMKKKASGLMTTWKPRLFILRGRRLSYYYSENDTEERGLIDISGHKVLVANDDPIVTLHASVTGAQKAASTPRASSNPASPTKLDAPTGVFYFKLVPPKSGLSRAVQFTKPAIHYFQVDSVLEGRKWMGEIMKATIEHDLSTFETTNKQKTISLAKARARRERPPELVDTVKVVEEDETVGLDKDNRKSGLGINIPEQSQTPDEAPTDAHTSPKALSTLGLGPKVSLKKEREETESQDSENSNEEKENQPEPVAATAS